MDSARRSGCLCSWPLDAAQVGTSVAGGALEAQPVGVGLATPRRLANTRCRRMGSSESAAVKPMKSAFAHVKPTPAPSACANSFSVCPLSIAMHDGGATPIQQSNRQSHRKCANYEHRLCCTRTVQHNADNEPIAIIESKFE